MSGIGIKPSPTDRLTPRAINILERADITTLRDLQQYNATQLLLINGIDTQGLMQVRTSLAAFLEDQ